MNKVEDYLGDITIDDVVNREKSVIELFTYFNHLKNLERSGWKKRNINRERVESVAEHIYGTLMLAYAMYSEFGYKENIDIEKVLLILAIHEIVEPVVGDITPLDMTDEQKAEVEHDAAMTLLDSIPNNHLIKGLLKELEDLSTPEGIFAHNVEKTECVFQAYIYDEEGAFENRYKKGEISKVFADYLINKQLVMNNAFEESFKELVIEALEYGMHIEEHSNDPRKNVISFYTLTNCLKNKQRKGEEIWNIHPDHYGSIAEHVFSTISLVISMYLVYDDLDIDIKRAVSLLAFHELGECKIGDISTLLKTDKDKKNESDAVKTIASILTHGEYLVEAHEEFDGNKTPESKCTKYVDKLAPDIMSKIYDQDNLIDLEHQEGNSVINLPSVQKYLRLGDTFSTMWIKYGQDNYKYPKPYINVSNYALNNRVTESISLYVKEQIDKKIEKTRNN